METTREMRHVIEEIMPDAFDIMVALEELTDIDFQEGTAMDVVLEYMDEVTDEELQKPVVARNWWLLGKKTVSRPLIAGGVQFKSTKQQLDDPGWPLGTACWYVPIVGNDWMVYIADRDNELTAALRGALWVAVTNKLRRKDKWPSIDDVIAYIRNRRWQSEAK